MSAVPYVFPGYDINLPDDILPGSGALALGENGPEPTILGVTRGGLAFDPGRELTQIDYDGAGTTTVGLEFVSKYDSTIKGKMIQVGDSTLPTLEPGVDSMSGSGIVDLLYFMQPSGVFLADSAYGKNLRLVFARRTPGKFVQVRFAYWICTKYDIASKPKDAAEVTVEFHARLNPAEPLNPFTGQPSSTLDCPYAIEYLNSIKTLPV